MTVDILHLIQVTLVLQSSIKSVRQGHIQENLLWPFNKLWSFENFRSFKEKLKSLRLYLNDILEMMSSKGLQHLYYNACDLFSLLGMIYSSAVRIPLKAETALLQISKNIWHYFLNWI